MRKLLIMASLFYPQKNGGGPPVSIMNVVQAIKDKFEIYIISHNHEVGDIVPLPGVTDGWNEFDFGKVYYFPYDKYNIKNIYSLIKIISPDVIYQNSFFSHQDAIATLMYKKKYKNTGVVVAPRGEMCVNRFNKGKLKKTIYTKLLKTFSLLKDVHFQATGYEEVYDTSFFLRIDKSLIHNINNFSYANENHIAKIEKKKGELKLCFIARIQDTKNLLYAIERLKEIEGTITYDIYGPIENREYYEKCFSVELSDNIHLNYCGVVDHNEVGKVISKYHAYYMPTIGENYGHSIVESMLYARPVIISNKTPWNDINNENAGFAINLDKPLAFQDVLQKLCIIEQDEFDLLCQNAKEFIGKKLKIDETIQKYIDLFNEV